jgi:hypothetical protein
MEIDLSKRMGDKEDNVSKIEIIRANGSEF